MNCELLHIVKTAFNALWTCDPIDNNTIRITTPYASITDKYVSLFLKKQGDEFIVSDGGILNEYLSSKDLGEPNEIFFNRIIECYLHEYEIRKKVVGERIFYFKKTNNLDFLPNFVFELSEFSSQFLSGIRTTNFDKSIVESDDVDEEADTFTHTGQVFFETQLGNNKDYQIFKNRPFGLPKKEKKVDLLIQNKTSVKTIQFLGGGKFYYYKSRINNVAADYRMMAGIPMLDKRLAIFDDTNEIYIKKRSDIAGYLDVLSNELDYEPIPWSQKERALEQVL